MPVFELKQLNHSMLVRAGRPPHRYQKSQQVRQHLDKWDCCVDCKLHKDSRNYCFYRGAIPCDILYVGEAPGSTEDTLSLPMIGPTKDIIDSIHVQAQLSAKEPLIGAITNTVLCRPPQNRDPSPLELQACFPRLIEFIEIAEPSLLVLMGKVAGSLLDEPFSLSGRFSSMKVCSVVHPAHILREQNTLLADNKLEALIHTIVSFYSN